MPNDSALAAHSRKLTWLAAILMVAQPASSVPADPDLWWHLLAGREILATHTIPRFDSWTYTVAGAPWVNHEWLPEIALAAMQQLGGDIGLLTWRCMQQVVLVLAWVAVVLRRVPCPPLALLLVGIPWVYVAQMCNLRPHTATWTLVAVVIWLLDRVQAGSKYALGCLILTIWLWTNLHGGMLFGWGIASCGLVSISLGWEGAPSASATVRRRCLYVLPFLLLVQVANPMGLDLHVYIVREMLAAHPQLPEWQPPTGDVRDVAMVAGAFPLLLLAIVRRPIRITSWVALLVAIIAASHQAKMITLVLLLSPICVADALAPSWNKLTSFNARLQYVSSSPIVLIASVAFLLLSQPHVGPSDRFRVVVNPERYPVAALDWLKHNFHGTGRLLVPLGWGGIALGKLGEGWRVSIDGRNTTVFPVLQVNRDAEAWYESGNVLSLYRGPDAILSPTDSAAAGFLGHRAEWTTAYKDTTASVWLPSFGMESMHGSRRAHLATLHSWACR